MKLEFFVVVFFFVFPLAFDMLSTVANSRRTILLTHHRTQLLSNSHDVLHQSVHGALGVRDDRGILRGDVAAHGLDNGQPPLHPLVPLLLLEI